MIRFHLGFFILLLSIKTFADFSCNKLMNPSQSDQYSGWFEALIRDAHHFELTQKLPPRETKVSEVYRDVFSNQPGFHSVKRVFYPMSGADSGLGFLLFPNADTVVGVGLESAFGPQELNESSITDSSAKLVVEGYEAVFHRGTLDGENLLIPRLIANLTTAFKTSVLIQSVQLVPHSNNDKYDAVIKFKVNGEDKVYIHLARAFNSDTVLSLSDVFKPQALIAKGSMDVWHNGDDDRVATMRQGIVNTLIQNHGVLVEGESLRGVDHFLRQERDQNNTEYSDEEVRLMRVQGVSNKYALRSFEFSGINNLSRNTLMFNSLEDKIFFSYGTSIKITWF